MAQAIWEQVQALLGLGLDVGDVGALQMALRTLAIYAFTLAIVRLGSKRLLSQATAFDFIVSIMIGSVMSRAINGSAPFVPTLLAGIVMIALHTLLAVVAFRTDWFGSIVKGNPVLLIKDGEIQQQGVRQSGVSEQDLIQAIRLQAKQTDPSKIRLAYLERNGQISVIPYEHEPRIQDISVANGVQTVRIELE
ncbi:MAG: DUF421 domain-containing protein [Caldilineaceae bacterium]|nr:DUF421 domain-containing protein [Caldilineaceae bacterium]